MDERLKKPWWARTLESLANGALAALVFWFVAHVLFHFADHQALYLLAWMGGANAR